MSGEGFYNKQVDKGTRSANSDLNLETGSGDWSFKDIASNLMDFDVEMLRLQSEPNLFHENKGGSL
jgi:hypothetical protein